MSKVGTLPSSVACGKFPPGERLVPELGGGKGGI